MSLHSPGKIIFWIIMASFTLMPVMSSAEPSTTDKTTINDIKQDMNDVANSISNYSVNQRDKAVKEVKASLDAIDIEIESMEDRFDKNLDKMNQVSLQKTRAALMSLKKQRNEVARWYVSLQDSTDDAWQDVKNGFLKSYQSLQKSFDDAQKEF